MKAPIVFLLVLAALVLLGPTVLWAAPKADSIVVSGADVILSPQVQTPLDFGQSPVRDRVVVQYGNDLDLKALSRPPSELETALAQVAPRVVVQYGDPLWQARIPALPEELALWLGRVSDRVILQYAATNLQAELSYPLTAMNDTKPPAIAKLQAVSQPNGALVTWETDEFATSVLRYGVSENALASSAAEPLFGKKHSLALRGLNAKTIFYRVECTDRSGNTASSSVQRVDLDVKTYVPMLVK